MTLFLLIFALGMGLIVSLAIRSYLIQFPFFATAVFAGWVFPQLFNLYLLNDLPHGAFERYAFFSIVSLVLIWIGYARERRPASLFSTWQFSERRLLFSAIALSVLGHLFWYLVGVLAPTANVIRGGWSGPVTIAVFFGEMLVVGLTIAALLHLQRPTLTTTLIIMFGLLHYIYRAFGAFRREEMIELGFMALMFFWWKYRWLPSRMLVVGALFFGFFAINMVGDLRSVEAESLSDRLRAVAKIDYFEGVVAKFGDPYFGQEVREGALIMEATARTGAYDFGTYFWDRFVHQFLPGQLVGFETKQALIFDRGDPLWSLFGHYRLSEGVTETGMADAFRSFWYFGVLIFFIIARIIKRWWLAAERGNFVARLVILLVMSKSLLAITHTTPHFFLHFVTLSVFLLPFLIFSRARRKSMNALATATATVTVL